MPSFCRTSRSFGFWSRKRSKRRERLAELPVLVVREPELLHRIEVLRVEAESDSGTRSWLPSTSSPPRTSRPPSGDGSCGSPSPSRSPTPRPPPRAPPPKPLCASWRFLLCRCRSLHDSGHSATAGSSTTTRVPLPTSLSTRRTPRYDSTILSTRRARSRSRHRRLERLEQRAHALGRDAGAAVGHISARAALWLPSSVTRTNASTRPARALVGALFRQRVSSTTCWQLLRYRAAPARARLRPAARRRSRARSERSVVDASSAEVTVSTRPCPGERRASCAISSPICSAVRVTVFIASARNSGSSPCLDASATHQRQPRRQVLEVVQVEGGEAVERVELRRGLPVVRHRACASSTPRDG